MDIKLRGLGADMSDMLLIKAFWDEEAEVWVATSQDIPGLVAEASTQEELTSKLQNIIPELLELNNVQYRPIHLVTEQNLHVEVANVAQTKGFTKQLKKTLTDNGCYFVRNGKGDHQIWFSPISNINFTVDSNIKSRHTANEVLKQAGLEKKFQL